MSMKASPGSGVTQRVDPKSILPNQLLPAEDRRYLKIPEPLHPPIRVSDTISTPLTGGESILTIGEGVTFSGKVIEADSIDLERSADGDINARSVEIPASGSLTGTVSCEILDVACCGWCVLWKGECCRWAQYPPIRSYRW